MWAFYDERDLLMKLVWDNTSFRYQKRYKKCTINKLKMFRNFDFPDKLNRQYSQGMEWISRYLRDMTTLQCRSNPFDIGYLISKAQRDYVCE